MDIVGLNLNILLEPLVLGNVHDLQVGLVSGPELNSLNIPDAPLIAQVVSQIFNLELFRQQLVLFDLLSAGEVVLIQDYSVDFEEVCVKVVFFYELY